MVKGAQNLRRQKYYFDALLFIFSSIYFRIVITMCTCEIGLHISFHILSLSEFEIRVVLASQIE